MSIWKHSEVETPYIYDLRTQECQFCKSKMIKTEVDNLWAGLPSDLKQNHKRSMYAYAEVHGAFLLEDIDIMGEPDEEDPDCYCCSICGWWFLSKTIWISTKHQIWHMYYGAAGALRHLDSTNISEPISEVRRYLAANYSYRFSLSPRKFEEVLTSVFKSAGYQAQLTNFSNDGGIDIFLQDQREKIIGVQVKRYKNSVKIEQIRSFLGALVLRGLTSGVFVTTSKFQAGAKKTVEGASMRGIQMNLIDAEKLLELLKISQLADFENSPDFSHIGNRGQPVELNFFEEVHLNSI
jgi:restriction system protein